MGRLWLAGRLWRDRSGVAGYGLAVGSVVVALALTRLLGTDRVGMEPLFFAAVMVSAYFGGLGPGLVATALAAACTAYFFLDPPNSWIIAGDDIVRTIIFIAVAVLISSLHVRTQNSEREMQRAKEEAQAANRAKDRFLAIVSHELRSPLNPVMMLASLWEEDASLPERARRDMQIVRRSAELEVRLIDDLLDISRITAGKLVLKREPTDVAEVVQDAVAVCAAEARDKGVEVHVAIDDDARNARINGDGARLRQIVWNLLRNAVKFTPKGGSATIAAAMPSPQAIELSVADTGVGIDPAVLPRVFDAFDQGGAEVTTRFGGLGLGLAIAKALTEAHGGTIEARSEGKNRGATFVIRLPIDAAPSPVVREIPEKLTAGI